jgi:hypothetical protein
MMLRRRKDASEVLDAAVVKILASPRPKRPCEVSPRSQVLGGHNEERVSHLGLGDQGT